MLIDGRSAYTPTFSGVYWDVQDTLLEDIDRIEVVRGPGGTLWGSNAVNGVINIITKSAASTLGTSVQVGGGSDERAFVGARYGGTLGGSGHFRVYAKSFDRNASELSLTGTTASDDWHQVRAGGRVDLKPGEQDSLTIQGDAYKGKAGEAVIAGFLAPPFHVISPTQTETQGANVLLRWQHQVSSADSFTLQSYVDHTRRDWPAHTLERRTTFDVDFQYHTQRLNSQDIVMGFGFRDSDVTYSASFIGIPANTLPYLQIMNHGSGQRLINLFVQDDITLLPRKFTLTLGAKVEHHEDTGTELSPNARLLWTPTETTTVWGSVARAVRTPSREGLQAAQTGAFDVILMDCQMPGMDGYEATACIRKWEAEQQPGSQVVRRVPIVALTTNAMQGDRERCLASGMDEYLAKPFSTAALGNMLQRICPPERLEPVEGTANSAA